MAVLLDQTNGRNPEAFRAKGPFRAIMQSEFDEIAEAN
jgi:hypothetical protein